MKSEKSHIYFVNFISLQKGILRENTKTPQYNMIITCYRFFVTLFFHECIRVSKSMDEAQARKDVGLIPVQIDWLQSLKPFFINVSYHILVASLTLMARF